MRRRILVTGASGFVGAALVEALAQAGHRVRAATRAPTATVFPPGVEVAGVPDFQARVDWGRLLEDVDTVVHLAGIAHTGLRLEDSVYDRVIHQATADLVAACAPAGVRRLVFLSSVRAQSGPTAGHILSEDDAAAPSDAYGRAKLKAEGAVRAFGGAWTILRPVVVCGPGVKGNLASLVRLADTPWPLPLAALSGKRSLIGRDDLLAAIMLALDSEATAQRTFLVADPEPLTLAEMVVALRRGLGRPARLFPVPPSLIASALKAMGRADVWDRLGGSLVVDPSRLIAAGWQPAHDIRGELARMAKAARGRAVD